MEITVVISALVGIATRKEFSPGNLFRLWRRKVLIESCKVSQFFLLGGLPRAIDLAELALAVGALLFSEATEEGSDSTVEEMEFISNTRIAQGWRQGYGLLEGIIPHKE